MKCPHSEKKKKKKKKDDDDVCSDDRQHRLQGKHTLRFTREAAVGLSDNRVSASHTHCFTLLLVLPPDGFLSKEYFFTRTDNEYPKT